MDGLHQAAGSSADLVVEVHGSTQDMDRNLDDSAGIFCEFYLRFMMDLRWIYGLPFLGIYRIFQYLPLKLGMWQMP